MQCIIKTCPIISVLFPTNAVYFMIVPCSTNIHAFIINYVLKFKYQPSLIQVKHHAFKAYGSMHFNRKITKSCASQFHALVASPPP